MVHNRKILVVEDEFLEANNLRIILEKSGYRVCGVARTVLQAQELVRETTPEVVLIDIYLKGQLTGIDLARWLSKMGTPFIFLSANSNKSTLDAAKETQPYGFLVKPFRERDVLIALEIAVFRHQQINEVRIRQERWLSNFLQTILEKESDVNKRWLLLAKGFQPFIQFDYILIEPSTAIIENSLYGFKRISYDEYEQLDPNVLLKIWNSSIAEVALLGQSAVDESGITYYNEQNFLNHCTTNRIKEYFRKEFAIRSILLIPVIYDNGATGTLSFLARQPVGFNEDHVELLRPLHPLLVHVIQNISANKGPLINKQPTVPEPSEDFKTGFPGIVGKNAKLLAVLDQVRQVAPYDTSVLILGETGVGKEGLMEAIHRASSRCLKPIIKINCAAIPAGLIESELFGHERGAYTDARERRIGKFELAQGGTVFLDEIGEIPLDIQSKLLRVLQEKEIERVGGRSTIKVDVRIIAATNRNLYKEVADGNFRMDLYFRINVFPIMLPPLRERKDDIPLLVDHFLHKYAERQGSSVISISKQALQNLSNYSWPGNIRELEHAVERLTLTGNESVIPDPEIQNDHHMPGHKEQKKDVKFQTIEEVEKAYILLVLQKCNGRIAGRGGAAEILQLPPSSLSLKMKKLGISWHHIIK
jgi:DNA-binding NtrC family response regulator